MPRPGGLPKTGGRKKGTPNKKTKDVMELLESMGCNPIERLVSIAEDPEVDVAVRVRIYAELASYIFPKRKSMSIDMSVKTEPYQQRLIKLLKEVAT